MVHRAKDGDRTAFEELVRRHHVHIIALCVSLLHDSSNAEDAAQETFIKAFQSLSGFRGESAFGTWIYRIAYHTCLDRLRSDKRRRAESLEALAEVGREPAMPAHASREEQFADRDLLNRLLAELPDNYRAVLLLREGQGLSYEEISTALDCTLDAVKARLKRARQSLRDAMDRLHPSERKTL